MAAKDEEGNVNADGNQAESREMYQDLEEIFSNPLLYEALPDRENESSLGEKKVSMDTSDSCSLGYRSIWNTSIDQETSNEQGTSNQLRAVSSTTSNVPVTSVKASSSDITNVETKSSTKAPVKNDQPAMNLPQTQRNPQAMNPRYPQWQVPSGQYGNIMRPPYFPSSAPPFQQHGGSYMVPYGTVVPFTSWRPDQIYMGPPYFPPSAPPFQQHGGSNMRPYGTMVPFTSWRPEQMYMGPPYFPPSAPPFQQHGGSTSNMALYGNVVISPYLRPEQNDIYNYNMPQHVPPNYDVYMGPYAYGYDNHSDTSAYSRFGYDGPPGNYMSSIRQPQIGDSVVYTPSSSSQQQRQQQPRSDDSATQNQQDDRSDDPSDQTQRDN